MRKFTAETSIAARELEQLVYDWGYQLDMFNCEDVAKFFTEDCVVESGAAMRFKGREAMTKFYADRNERVRTQQKDGVRTQRHGIGNMRFVIHSADRATVTFLISNYSGEGKPPLFNATTPTIITDVRFECARGKDGLWRIAEFYGTPVFIGGDPFLNAGMVGKAATK